MCAAHVFKKLWSARLKSLTVLVIVIAVTFFCYQILSLQVLSDELQHSGDDDIQRLTKVDPHVYREKGDGSKLKSQNAFSKGWMAIKNIFNKNSTRNGTKEPWYGVPKEKIHLYSPDANGMFTCIKSGKKIPWEKVNDNYCDCEQDGSDEPSTSACTNGVFYCSSYSKISPSRIPSSRVGDGICDCCDGTDEWQKKTSPVKLDVEKQKKLGRFLSPCSNRCSS